MKTIVLLLAGLGALSTVGAAFAAAPALEAAAPAAIAADPGPAPIMATG